jgi:hypothetical protein
MGKCSRTSAALIGFIQRSFSAASLRMFSLRFKAGTVVQKEIKIIGVTVIQISPA